MHHQARPGEDSTPEDCVGHVQRFETDVFTWSLARRPVERDSQLTLLPRVKHVTTLKKGTSGFSEEMETNAPAKPILNGPLTNVVAEGKDNKSVDQSIPRTREKATSSRLENA